MVKGFSELRRESRAVDFSHVPYQRTLEVTRPYTQKKIHSEVRHSSVIKILANCAA